MTAKERKARKQYSNKATVVGILERDGDVRVAHIRKQDAPAMVYANVCQDDATLMTDAAIVYRQLGAEYEHHSVNHSIGEYARMAIRTA